VKRFLVLVLLAVLALVGTAVVLTLRTPDDLYLVAGSFAGCPSRPSCVSSQAGDDEHRVAGLVYSGDPQFAQSLLREILQRMDGRLVDEAPNYLHAVFESNTMHFRDDLELLIRPDGQIDVRSASRFGYGDFGNNRERVESLRRAFEASP